MPKPKHLPKLYYEHSVIGKRALDGVNITREQHARGLTREGFLFAQMEDTYTLPISQTAISKLPARRSKANWRYNLASAPGFCYLKLMPYEWVVPALCVLGAYPDASDVARLAPYWRTDCPNNSWAIIETGTRRRTQVLHIKGHSRPLTYSAQSKLAGSKGSLVGAQRQHPPRTAYDRYYNPTSPSTRDPPDYIDRPNTRVPRGSRGRGGRPYNDRPRHTDNDDKPGGGPDEVDFHRRYEGIGRHDWGNRGGPRKRAPAAQFFQPYDRDPNKRRQGSPSNQAQSWMPATRDELDETMDNLKASLKNLPRHAADLLWNDFLAWFQDLKKKQGFDRSHSIQEIKEYFSSLYDPADKEAKANAKALEQLETRGIEIGETYNRIAQLERELEDPPPGRDLPTISAELLAARWKIIDMDEDMDDMEAEEIPPSMLDDPLANNDDFIPLEADAPPPRPWEESNYEDYEKRAEPLFPTCSGKADLDELLEEMDVPSNSKILLPRPLELYTQAEINSARPAGRAPWFNWHEDPLEPIKCWGKETFTRVFSKAGFHFLIARVAQLGPQSKDPKLQSLRDKLASRWDCPVEITTMDPRQDWMFCTIPDTQGPRAEILTTALMRLANGNASYVVRHLGPLAKSRDLIVMVKGTTNDANGVYAQLKKRQLEFESKGINLGWRVMGVQRTSSPLNYRATFTLETRRAFWPWTLRFGHTHGTINALSPLLNFDPPWQARKPYACQACYSSVHATNECPLTSIRIGGVPIVSHAALLSILNKKAAERVIKVDRSLMPKKGTTTEPFDPRPPVEDKGKGPVSPIAEEPELADRQSSVYTFLISLLQADIVKRAISLKEIKQASRSGSLQQAFRDLNAKLPHLNEENVDTALEAMEAWVQDGTVPDPLHDESKYAMSIADNEEPADPSGKDEQQTPTSPPAGEMT